MKQRKAVKSLTQIALILLITAIDSSSALREQFIGHQLLKITPSDEHQMKILHQLHELPPSDIQHLDFWSEPSGLGEAVFVRVDPFQASQVKDLLRKASISYDVITNDVQRLLDEHHMKIAESRKQINLNIYDSYLTYDEIISWLEETVALCSSLRCSLIDIGRSYEGRRLVVVKISNGDSSESTHKKPAVWIDAGIHAREWISHSTALYFLERLVVDHAFDDSIRSMLDVYDFYIMPCVNPDGYEYSHLTNRLWRKTRSAVKDSSCRGADANRNFGFFWGTSGSSSDPCSDIYRGPVAFSEPESRAIADFIIARNSTWTVYLTLHSYSQMWMAPYGYTWKKPPNYRNMMSVAEAVKTAIQRVYGTDYAIGSASEILYRSAGTSRDWAAGVAKIPFVYTVELRDTGSYGFLLPPQQILPTQVETWEGVKAMMAAIRNITIVN